MQDQMQPLEPQEPGIPNALHDNEGAMAKADLYKLAKYSMKLFKDIQDDTELESWVQAKITKAADYIASVYHYLEYEMKFSEYGHHLDNSDTLSESQKTELKNRLMEAKKQVATLKKQQADKLKKVEEGKAKCTCDDTKASHKSCAVHGKVEEGQEDLKKTGDSYKTSKGGTVTKTATGVKHERDPNSYSDEEHGEPPSKVKEKSAAEKKADKEKEIKLPKHKGNTWGMKGGEKFGKKMEEGSKPDFADLDKDGDEKEPMKKAAKEAKKDKKVDEASKSPKAKKDYDGDGKIETGKDEYLGSKIAAAKKAGKLKEGKKCNECGMLLEKCSCEKVDEAQKPSAGLSKKEKSAVVKKAKAGKDIGKPGKGFAKVEKAAKKSGAKDPKAVAAAAMWKNIKESVAIAVDEGNMTDQQYKDALDKVRRENPQALAAALNSKDPNALNKLLGFKLNPGEKTTPMVSDPEGVPMKKEAQSPFPSRNAPANPAPAAGDPSANYSPEKKDAIAKAKRQMAIMPSRGKEMMDKAMAMPESINESAELDRIKQLTQILKG